jgi:hypothetical protein
MKKMLALMYLTVLLLILTGCGNDLDTPNILDKEQPVINFGDSTRILETDLLDYVNDFETKYITLNTQCSYERNSQSEIITRNMVEESYEPTCDSAGYFLADFDIVKTHIDILFNLYDDIISNEFVDMNESMKAMIDFNGDAFRLTVYKIDESLYLQYILATIDDNIYYQYITETSDFDKDVYNNFIYYENGYIKIEIMNQFGIKYYQKDLKSSEILGYNIFFDVGGSSHYIVMLQIGDENYINTVQYKDAQFVYLETKQLDGDYVEFTYNHNQHIVLNALELDDWNLLKIDPNDSYSFKMYDDKQLLYENLTIVTYDNAQSMPSILIDLSEETASVLTIGDMNFDLQSIILSHDTYNEKHIQLMEYYHIDIEESTYEDYKDAFTYIDDYFREFINE